MSFLVTCFNCNNGLTKDYESSVVVVCPKCGSINRSDGKVVPFKIAAEDMSPIRIGTEGTEAGKTFKVTGRIRFDFKTAYRNQWSVLFSDNTTKWLSESYGYYCLYSKSNANVSSDRWKNMKAGGLVEITGRGEYVVESIRKNARFSGEGELHELTPLSVEFFQVEASNEKGELFLVNIISSNDYQIFEGNYYDFEQLSFKKLREAKEWM